MLYLIGYEYHSKTRIYTVFHSETKSVIYGDAEKLEEYISVYNEIPVNFKVSGDKLVEIDMVGGIFKSDITLSRTFMHSLIDNNIFQAVTRNGRVRYIDMGRCKRIIDGCRSSNCAIRDGKIIHKYVNEYIIQEKIKEVRKQYQQFISKSKLLGMDSGFRYSITDTDVILEEYIGDTGINANAIVPSFVTSIGEQAFYDTELNRLDISESVKYLGGRAFMNSSINRLQLPKELQFVGYKAFSGFVGNITRDGLSMNDKIRVQKHKEDIEIGGLFIKSNYTTDSFYSYFE